MSQTKTEPISRKELTLVILLLALAGLLWTPRLNGLIDLRWDAGVYYSLGTSLAEGKGYRLLYEPGEIHATQYPPLLPGVIAIHQLILGSDDPLLIGRWLRLSWFLLFAIYLCLVYWMARISLPRIYAFFVAALCLFSPRVVFMSDLGFPEILFSITTMSAFIFSRRVSNWISELGGSLFVVCSYLLRTIGIAMAAAWLTDSILKRKLKVSLIRLALIMIPVLFWMGYVRMVEKSSEYKYPAYLYQRADYLYYNVSYPKNVSYKDPFMPELGKASSADLLSRFGQNLKQVPIALAETVNWDRRSWKGFGFDSEEFFFFHRFLASCLWSSAATGLAMLCGVLFQLIKGEILSGAYILFSLAMICSAPWPMQIVRYLTPLIPFLMVATVLVLAGGFFLGSFPNRIVKWIGTLLPPAVLLLLFVQEIPPVANMYRKHYTLVVYQQGAEKKVVARWFYYDEFYQALDQGLDWLHSRTNKDDVIASSMPSYVFLRTGNRSVMPPFRLDPKEAQHLLDSVPVKYVIIDGTENPVSRRYGSRPVVGFPNCGMKSIRITKGSFISMKDSSKICFVSRKYAA